MMNTSKNTRIKRSLPLPGLLIGLLLTVLLLMVSCSEEFFDPANPVGSQVEESAEGLTGLAVGLQSRWSVGRQSPVYNIITGPGFTTG
ncbi:MAG: hypothetical protein AAFP70_20375, partial [Calditrichota bacterium]